MKTTSFILSILVLITFTFGCGSPVEKDKAKEKEAMEIENKEKKPQLPNTLTREEKLDGWMLLFNGKSDKGWRGYNKEGFPEKGWAVEDGMLHVMGSGAGEAGGGGDIISTRTFSDFELSLEWKVSEGGNSGIFYLAQEKEGQPIWKSAPEMQILDNEKHPDAKLGIDGNRAAGSLYDLIPGNMDVVKPAGEWNHVKILVYRGTVVHTVNGVNVLEYHLWTDDWKAMVANSKFKDYPDFVNPAKNGHIGLQDHGDDVWFRSIKIKNL